MRRLGEALPPEDQPGGPVGGGEQRVSIWPAIHPRILELIRAHRSTLVFVNSRRLAERLAQRLNELAGEELVRAHHGSIAREQRVAIEEALKEGRLPALVATSSLELGIDMGAIDLVIQVESPTSVARGLQRVGRAGHRVDEVSRGVIFPKYRGDLLECAVVAERMREGAIEATTIPRNPLDVLAQQIVAMTVMDRWSVDDLLATVTRAAPFETLTRETLEGVLAMLAGAYPSDEFAELKPRLVWDRVADTLEGRRDARVVAVTSGGTIPDRGLFGVFVAGEAGTPGRRVGELDEEMVYELRAGMHGDVIVLGASSWRVLEITPERVIVAPAPGEPGKLPFWKGDAIGRPIELGRALGAFVREVEGDLGGDATRRGAVIARLRERHHLDELAAENLVAYLEDEREAAGALPTDRRVVVERFRDELGDWRLVLLTPFGGRVHAPWSLAIEARLRERLGQDVASIWSDDGIAIRLPEGDLEGVEEALFPDPEEIEDLVVAAVGGSALFAARFRENAARALLLPRRRPGSRTPLWQQRQRSADLLAVASRFGSFPILVETYRECLADVFDLPALREVLGGIAGRQIRVHRVETPAATPMASSLLFDYVAAYMYEGDAPLAERRAQALTLDRDLLRELLGQEELRELLDPAAFEETELGLQALRDDRKAGSVDQVADLLRRLGDLSEDDVAARTRGGPPAAREWLETLAATRRAILVRIQGEPRWIAVEDAGRYRDATGSQPPQGTPIAFLGPTTDALGGLLARWARTHGPFLAVEPAHRWGLPAGIVAEALGRLADAGTILLGEFRPGGAEREWCDPEVLRVLRRRSLARLRREVEPVDTTVFARFLPAWQGIAPLPAPGMERPAPLRGQAALERLAEAIDQLAGVPIPASILERDVLAGRVAGYQPRLLDELGALGEVAWIGCGALGRDDGRVALFRPGRGDILRGALATSRAGTGDPAFGPRHAAIRDLLSRRGALFYREIFAAAGGGSDREVLDALWDLVWSGDVTNDTFAPLRALRWKRPGHDRRPRPGRLATLGPPEAAGRWSLVGPLDPSGAGVHAGPGGAAAARDPGMPGATLHLHAQALVLLDRHGVVTREAVLAEGIDGGFAAIYPVLRALEEAGRIRRGYFVDGLGAAQFALAGAIDRLRATRDAESSAPRVDLLAAADPAQPYGAALGWPRRDASDRRPYQRAAGAYVAPRRRGTGSSCSSGAVTGSRRCRPPTIPGGWSSRSARCERCSSTVGYASSSSTGSTASPWAPQAHGAIDWPPPASRPATAGWRSAARARERAIRMPEGDTLFRMAAGLRPHLVGRVVTAARARVPGPRVERVVGSEVTAVEAHGKNLLIEFANGLEIRTHLRMTGSWHRYAPGERWRRPLARAALVLEVPGAVAVCFDAPVVELLEARAAGLHPALGDLGPDLCADEFDAARRSAACAPRPGPRGRSRKPSWISAPWRGSGTSSRARSCSSSEWIRSRLLERSTRRRWPVWSIAPAGCSSPTARPRSG